MLIIYGRHNGGDECGWWTAVDECGLCTAVDECGWGQLLNAELQAEKAHRAAAEAELREKEAAGDEMKRGTWFPLFSSLLHPLTPALTHSLLHSLTPALTHSLTHSLTHPPTGDEESRVNQSSLRGYGLLRKCSRSVRVD